MRKPDNTPDKAEYFCIGGHALRIASFQVRLWLFVLATNWATFCDVWFFQRKSNTFLRYSHA